MLKIRMLKVPLLKMLALSLLFVSVNGFAIEKPEEADLVADEEIVDDDVLELDRMSVTGRQYTLKTESKLRVVRQGMNEPRSNKKEDRDKMICWVETPVGTNLKHVMCARNGDLEALRNGGKDGEIGGAAGYGRKKIWKSLSANNEAGLRRAMESLPEDDYFDRDFVAIAASGGQPPRDVPDNAELEVFVKAYIKVEELAALARPEAEVIAAIEAGGMSLKRYNRVVELTREYESVRAKVTELVIEEKNLKP